MNASSLRIILLAVLLVGGMQTSCEKKIVSDFERGMEHFRNGDCDFAIWSWNIHLRRNPGHAEGYAYRGTAKSTKGDPDGALDQAALLAAAKKGGMSQARNQLCEAWYFAGMVRLFAGQEVEAAECFRRSIGTERKNYAELSFATAELEAIEGRTKRPAKVEASPVRESFRGKVHQVSRTSITLRDRKGGKARTFALHHRAPVTLDGNRVLIDRIKPSMDTTVTLDASGMVMSIDAKSGK